LGGYDDPACSGNQGFCNQTLKYGLKLGEPITRPERMSSRFGDGGGMACCAAQVKYRPE
jgi:hypothetical protein